MILKRTTILILTILSCYSLFGNTNNSNNNNNGLVNSTYLSYQNKNLIFSIDGGLSCTLENLKDSYSDNLKKQRRDMKVGYVLNGNFYSRISNHLFGGINIKFVNSSAKGKYDSNNEYHTPYYSCIYYQYYGGNTYPEYVSLSEKYRTYFLGPSITYELPTSNQKELLFTFAAGLLQYQYSTNFTAYTSKDNSVIGYPEEETI